MLPSHEIEFARRIYKDILNGYSTIEFEEKELYIKHFSDLDFGYIQEFKEEKRREAKQKGLLSEKEKIDILIENESWSREEEETLIDLKEEIKTLRITRSKLHLEKQIDAVTNQINDLQVKLKPLSKERYELVGLTVEKFGEDKINEEYLRSSLFTDKEFKVPAFSRDQYFDLDQFRLKLLLILNNNKLSELSKDNIDRVAAMPFFLNAVMLSKDNPQVFFGKSIIDLSNYQSELYTQGVRFCSVINKGQSPPSTASSIDYLIDFYEGALGTRRSRKDVEEGQMKSGATKKTKKIVETAGSAIFGANKKEAKAFAASQKNSKTETSFAKEIKNLAKSQKQENKTHFTMSDLLQIHGEATEEEMKFKDPGVKKKR